MPGFTKTFAEFEETATDRLGFCFSRVFILGSFPRRHIAQAEDQEIRPELKYILCIIHIIVKIDLSYFRVKVNYIRLNHAYSRLKLN